MRANGFLYTTNLYSLVPLILLPFVFPERRVGRRGLIVIGGIVALLLAPALFDRSLEFIFGKKIWWPWMPRFDKLLITISGSLGAILILSTYLKATHTAQRKQARLLLAAFVLKMAAWFNTPMRWWTMDWSRPASFQDIGFAAILTNASTEIGRISTVFASIAVVVALASALIRGRYGLRPPVPLGDVAFIFAFFSLGFLLHPLGISWDFEYRLVRPLLLAYAVLQYQLVVLDLRQNAPLFATAGFSAVIAVPLLIGTSTGPMTGDLEVKIALATAVTLAVAGLFFWSFASLTFGRQDNGMDRNQVVYQAALQAVATQGQGKNGDTDERFLRALRERLGISDRDHALLLEGLEDPGKNLQLVAGERFLERYSIERLLGSGGQSDVHLARDLRLDRPVAIKRLREVVPTEVARERFEREMRTVASIQHPNVLRVLDVEVVGQDAFLILEYAAGGSLRELITQEGRLGPEAFNRLASDLLSGLSALHARNTLHRDLKPSNVLIHADGTATLADLGVARDLEDENTLGLTRHGATPGTVRYMAPEQARGHRLKPSADVYSTAATLYEAWTGRSWMEPLAHESQIELQMRVAAAEPSSREIPGPPQLRAWFQQALDPNPRRRFRDAAAMLAAFPLPADAIDGHPQGLADRVSQAPSRARSLLPNRNKDPTDRARRA